MGIIISSIHRTLGVFKALSPARSHVIFTAILYKTVHRLGLGRNGTPEAACLDRGENEAKGHVTGSRSHHGGQGGQGWPRPGRVNAMP